MNIEYINARLLDLNKLLKLFESKDISPKDKLTKISEMTGKDWTYYTFYDKPNSGSSKLWHSKLQNRLDKVDSVILNLPSYMTEDYYNFLKRVAYSMVDINKATGVFISDDMSELICHKIYYDSEMLLSSEFSSKEFKSFTDLAKLNGLYPFPVHYAIKLGITNLRDFYSYMKKGFDIDMYNSGLSTDDLNILFQNMDLYSKVNSMSIKFLIDSIREVDESMRCS